MFANLKNKLIEEVKASPKLQQFANAAQAAVSSSSNTNTPPSQGGSSDSTATSSTTTTNENFFSITEEDTPQNSPYKPLKLPSGAVRGGRSSTPILNNGSTGAIPRTRKLSNSSMASDVSFRLPSYDSPAVYHLQSDLESGGSEMEDSASTAQLDVVSKEQLYDAYKKSLDRYHKYRCRYTDLARKYRDLERDSTRARSVLVETQEKAIRRISELREQCTLEQQAKAHLEEALRIEMDDMQCKVQAYQTKLSLLGENPENISAALIENAAGLQQINEPLIDLAINNATEATNGTNNLISLLSAADDENVRETAAKIANLEKELNERETQFAELTEQMTKSTATIEILRKQEEENALLLAQTKQAIHSELENKESEVKLLTESVKQLQGELQSATQQVRQLGEQSSELRELKDKLKETQTAKQEVDARIIASEHMLAQLKEQYVAKEKVLGTAEERIVALTKESDLKLQDVRQQNAQLNEMVQRYQQNEVSLAEIDNELNRTKNENDNLRASIAANERHLQSVQQELEEQREQADSLNQQRLVEAEALNFEKTKVEELTKQLNAEKVEHENNERKIQQLETQLTILNEQNANNESETIAALKAELHKTNAELGAQLVALREQHVQKEKELKTTTNKLAKQKKHHETQQTKLREQTAEEVERLKNELQMREQSEHTMRDEAHAREEQTELEKNELRAQVANILHEIAEMEDQMRIVQQSHATLESEKLKLETSIEQMQRVTESAEQGTQHWREQVAEVEERLKKLTERLQKVESENSQLAEQNCLLSESSNRLEKLIAERERQQANAEEEVSEVSEMRLKLETAEDAIEKLNEKMTQVLDENSRMHNAQELTDHDCRTLQDKCDALEKEKLAALDAHQCLATEMEQLKERNSAGEAEMREQHEQLGAELQRRIEELQRAAEVSELEIQKKTQQSIEEIAALRKQAEAFERTTEQLEIVREELLLLREQQDSLNQELNEAREELSEKTQALKQQEISLNELKGLKHELESTKQQLESLSDSTIDLKRKLNEDAELQVLAAVQERNALGEQFENLQREVELKERDSAREIVQLREQIQKFEHTTEELENAREQLLLLTGEKESLSQELAGANEELSEKREALAKVNSNLGELQALREELDTTKLKLATLKETESNLCAELERNQTILQAKLEDEEKFKSQLEDAKVHEVQLQERGAIEDSLRAELAASQVERAQHIQNLEAELNAAKADVEQLHESNDALQVASDQLKSKHQQQVDELERALKQLHTENSSMQAQVKAKATSAEKLINYEQLAIENEFLNTNAKHLESELVRQRQATEAREQDTEALKEKLKSLQCEMYVLKDSAADYNTQLEAKEKALNKAQEAQVQLAEELATQHVESTRLKEHARCVTIQNDDLQTKLDMAAQAIDESEQHHLRLSDELAQLRELHSTSEQLNERNDANVQTLNTQITVLKADVEGKKRLQQEFDALKIELVESRQTRESVSLVEAGSKSSTMTTPNDAEHLRRINETLQRELEDLKYKSSAEISNLQQEIEDMQSNAKHMTERMMELELLRAGMQAQQLLATSEANASADADDDKAELAAKLKTIMCEVHDVSNRNLFLEQKCENFLILEQSNERLKLQNSKLSRQLDETLVSMQHNEGITANTEFEYLKNIMFQYLTGSANGNNETLVKVISAVLKFSPQQTQVALEKEHQRRSLLNKIL